jgi:hypothetical protein
VITWRFALLIVLALAVGAAGQQRQTHDGYWWNGSNDSFRVGVVTGYLLAMNTVADVFTVKCVHDKNGGKDPDGATLEQALTACEETPSVKPFHEFSGFRAGQWSDGVDEFYKDFRNRGLNIELALKYVKDQLHGRPVKELEDEVTEWRREATK